MSIRAYLDDEGLLRVVSDLKDTPGYDGHLYKGIKISQDRSSGIHYVEISNITDAIPKAVEGLVAFVTLEELFTVDAKREQGIYKMDTAKAELRFSTNSNHYTLHIRSTSWKDLCDLHVAIRSGSIRPEMSYETPQSGLSGQEILANLEKTEQELKQSEEKFQVLVNAFKSLILELKKGWWSFCTKKRIIEAINEIVTPLNPLE